MSTSTPKFITRVVTLTVIVMVVFSGVPLNITEFGPAVTTVSGAPTVEDLQSDIWTESDSGGYLSFPDSQTVNINSMPGTSTSQLYTTQEASTLQSKESGSLKFNFRVDSRQEYGNWFTGFGTSSDLRKAQSEAVGIRFQYSGNAIFTVWEDGGKKTARLDLAQDTRYYATIGLNRSTGIATARIYNDPARTELVREKSLTFDEGDNYGHLFAVNSEGGGVSDTISGDVSDLKVTQRQRTSNSQSNAINLSSLTHTSDEKFTTVENKSLFVDELMPGDNDRITTSKSSLTAERNTSTIGFSYKVQSGSDYGSIFTGWSNSEGTPQGTDFAGMRINEDGSLGLYSKQNGGYYGDGTGSLETGKRYWVEATLNQSRRKIIANVYNSPTKNSESLVSSNLTMKFDTTVNYTATVFASAEGTSASGEITARTGNYTFSEKSPTFSGDDLRDYQLKNDAGATYNFYHGGILVEYSLDDAANSTIYTTDSKHTPGTSGDGAMSYTFEYDGAGSYGSLSSGWGARPWGFLGMERAGLPYAVFEWGNVYNQGQIAWIRTSEGTSSTFSISSDTPYYVELELRRADGEMVARIYSDRQKQNLAWNGTAPINTSANYNHTYAIASEDGDASGVISGQLGSFSLAGAATSGNLSGQVTNQNGQPVSNATVTVTGIDREQLNVNPSELDSRAQEILNELENSRPPEFSADRTLVGGDGLFTDASTPYVAAHPKADWGLAAYTDTPQLGNPRVQLPAGEEIALSVWDPTSGGFLQDGVNSDLPGGTADDTDIVIESVDHTGDTVDTRTVETDTTYDVGLAGGEHQLATTSLPAGFYRVYPEDNPETGYVIVVGDPQDIANSIQTDLKNEAGQYTAQAEAAREYLNNDVLVQYTTTTNANGSFSVDVPDSVTRVSVQAHKAPPGLQQDPQNTSLQDVREFYAVTDYNGSYVVPAEAGTYSVPTNDITIDVVETEAPKFADLGRFSNATEAFQALLQNLSYSDLPGPIQQRLDELDRGQLEETSERLQLLTNQNSELEARVEELTNRDLSEITINDSSDEELREQIQAQQQAINELRSTIESSESTAEVASGAANSSATFAESLTEEQVRVVAQFPNGTSKEVPMEYITVDQSVGSIVGQGGTQVAVENYPVGDASGVQFAYTVATEKGIGKTSTSATDPTADAIGLDAISLSSLRPGPDEQVDVTLVGDDETQVMNITNVRAVAPDGTELDTSTDGPQTATFTTSGEGRHYVEVEFQTASGGQGTLTHRIAAADVDQDMPPGVRVKQTPFGTLAVVGDGYEAGSVEVSNGGQQIDVTAQVGADADAPARTHLYAHGADLPPTSTLSVDIVRGDQQRAVQRHIEVTAHLPAISSDKATLYRGDDALPREGEGKLASVSTSADETTIVTVTDARGSLQLETNSNPGRFERISWWIDRNTPDFSLGILGQVPVLPTLPVPDVSGSITATSIQATAAPTIDAPGPAAISA